MKRSDIRGKDLLFWLLVLGSTGHLGVEGVEKILGRESAGNPDNVGQSPLTSAIALENRLTRMETKLDELARTTDKLMTIVIATRKELL